MKKSYSNPTTDIFVINVENLMLTVSTNGGGGGGGTAHAPAAGDGEMIP